MNQVFQILCICCFCVGELRGIPSRGAVVFVPAASYPLLATATATITGRWGPDEMNRGRRAWRTGTLGGPRRVRARLVSAIEHMKSRMLQVYKYIHTQLPRRIPPLASNTCIFQWFTSLCLPRPVIEGADQLESCRSEASFGSFADILEGRKAREDAPPREIQVRGCNYTFASRPRRPYPPPRPRYDQPPPKRVPWPTSHPQV